VRFGAVNTLRSVAEEVRVAQACEEAGFWGLGLGDTAPRLYLDVYPTLGACLQATTRLRIGPTVTNTVSRHWSVLGATARAFDEIAPGRFFAGVATGDGALHSVGLTPATWAQLERDVADVRTLAPSGLEIHIAASGPRGAEAAGRVATDLMLGTGLDAGAMRALIERARAARTAAGITDPLRIWVVVDTFLAPDAQAAEAARQETKARSNGFARFAFASTFEDKAVPEQWHGVLRERLAHYDFGSHAVSGATPNAALFDDVPELQAYLVNRFSLVGTNEECAARLRALAEETDLDGVWLALGPSTLIEDPPTMVRAAGDAFGDLMTLD
jgi:5,10-methylenetetrahydromethanopterin reductase